MKQFSAESILLPLQKMQQAHDEVAHRDILNFDLYTRLKHMVLHFYKYAGKIEAARPQGDRSLLRRTLIDAYIICMATANALNLSLGEAIDCDADVNDLDALAHHLGKVAPAEDPFAQSLRALVIMGGQMAKAIESADHIELGNPRSTMETLVLQLSAAVLGILGNLDGKLEDDVKARLQGVESRSIFLRSTSAAGC